MESEAPAISSTRFALLVSAQAVGLVVALLWFVGAVFAFIPSLMSAMILDAPGSEDSLIMMTLFASVFSLPYVAIAAGLLGLGPCAGSAWSLYKGDGRRSMLLAALMGALLCLPFLNLLAFGLATLASNVVCNGDMTCL